jgi:hypothetical protein
MTHTYQLDAHYAVIQLDALLRELVMSFQPTAEMLIAEVRERAPDEAGRRRLRALLIRYRADVLQLAGTVVALRAQCGTNPDDLPAADDDDIRAEYARLRAARDEAESSDLRRPSTASGSRYGAPAAGTLDTAPEGGGV